MKINFRAWRWHLTAAAVLTCSAGAAWAQQPLTGVKVAGPVAASPAVDPTADKQPTPAAPPAGTPAPGAPASGTLATSGETKAPAAPATLEGEQAADKLTPAPEPADPTEVVELVKERYPSGAIKIEREVTQDEAGNYLLHGAWRQFDERGRLIIDGRLSRNLKEGLWRRFYRGDETTLLATAPYKDFTAPFISSATFYADRLHGKWTITDSRQRKVHELEFIGGERHGMAVWYYPTAMLEAPFEHGSVNGDVLKFAADGTVIGKEHFEAGRMLAPKVEYFDQAEQHKKAEIGFLFATLVVKTPDSWEQGRLATFETRGQDEKHGPFIIWHASGQVAKQGEFRYNLPVGQITHWFPNSQKQLDGVYVDGRQEGVWTWWHENGQKAITGEYHDARPVGPWIWWTATGKVAQRTDLTHERAEVELTSESQSDLREARLQHVEPGLPMR